MAMQTYTMEEIKDKFIGKIGTPKRDKYETRLNKEIERITEKYTCPGDYIKQEIKQKKIRLKDFAIMMNMSQSNLTELLKSESNITPSIAQSLEQILDYPKEYWLSLQEDYDKELKKRKRENVIVEKSVAEQLVQAINNLNDNIGVLIALQQQNMQRPSVR